MRRQINLPRLTEEDALARIISWLRRSIKERERSYQTNSDPILYIPDVVSHCLSELIDEDRRQNPEQGHMSYQSDTTVGTGPFYAAAWNLCTRGILHPNPTYFYRQYQQDQVIGGSFSITLYGKEWLEEISGYECLPTEYGRFGQLLASHANRFGAGYNARSQEAIKCYHGHTYLACRAMCGAAAESILLALAIAKKGDEAEVLSEYKTVTGRTKLERMLLAQQNSYIQQEFATYALLLKYWRDDASHGAESNIHEGEAFTSLILLLRFAQFADDRWVELIGPT